jgi:hypothetical protein
MLLGGSWEGGWGQRTIGSWIYTHTRREREAHQGAADAV